MIGYTRLSANLNVGGERPAHLKTQLILSALCTELKNIPANDKTICMESNLVKISSAINASA